MFLWQKYASAEWLGAHEMSLQDAASNELAIIERPGRQRSLLQIPCRDRAKAEKLVREFGGTARPLPKSLGQAPSAHAPIRIGARLEILSEAPGSLPPDGKKRLVIPAAGAFGTGEHATTAMSLRLLEETTRKLPPAWRLLDAGTGTGILALAARRLGAGEVLGLDNDPRAIAHALQNARLNHIRNIQFVRSDVLAWKPPGRYDIITANLFSEVLIAALPIFRRALRARGRMIISGILRGQAAPVEGALRRFHFRLEEKRRRGKWVALLVAGSPDHANNYNPNA